VQRLTGFIFKFIRLLLGTGLLLSVLLICANAFGRYVLHAPIIWAEEVLGYVLVWVVYLGAVDVTRDGGHLSMDLLTHSLKPRWRRAYQESGVSRCLRPDHLSGHRRDFRIRPLQPDRRVADEPVAHRHTGVLRVDVPAGGGALHSDRVHG
jgi:hypothetical protein